ncbi:MAG TPA: glycosyl hydrolase family 17 protein [Candidatus Sulfopaludibacter sp.]|nr:glycosyl hydrolase family 17 protein [Candidatus Sulfopaludibacter sp.]
MKKNIPSPCCQPWSGIIVFSLLSFLVGTGFAGAAPETAKPAAVSLHQKKSALLDGIQRGVCYSGFRHGQHPDRGTGAVNPTDPQTLEDLQLLSRNGNFGLIRLYDSDENSEAVLRVIKANHLPLKVLLGAWLDAEVSNPDCPWHKEPYPQTELDANKIKNQKQIERAIRLANAYPKIVAAVAVGNEAMVSWTDHKVPVQAVRAYVRQVKRAVKQPVTVCDNFAAWLQNGPALAPELNFISVHSYPAWEGKGIDEALPTTIAELQAVRNALPHSRMVITEAGWASVATEFASQASETNQKRYFDELYAWSARENITTFFFEAFDEDWKGNNNDPNPNGAEKHWGLFTIDRKPKLVMAGRYPALTSKKDLN